MNLILFEKAFQSLTLPLEDARSTHIRQVLRKKTGERFDVGVINGPRGSAYIDAMGESGMAMSFQWEQSPRENLPINLIIGLPRPQTARRILRECSSFGVQEIAFFCARKSERSYAASRLWTTGEWRRHIIAGAQQAFVTQLPVVKRYADLNESLDHLLVDCDRLALDVYEAGHRLSRVQLQSCSAVLAVGPEGGWSPAKRAILRDRRFLLVTLNERVLRTETACLVGLSMLATRMGYL